MTPHSLFDPELSLLLEEMTQEGSSLNAQITARISDTQKSGRMHVLDPPKNRVLWLAKKPLTNQTAEEGS